MATCCAYTKVLRFVGKYLRKEKTLFPMCCAVPPANRTAYWQIFSLIRRSKVRMSFVAPTGLYALTFRLDRRQVFSSIRSCPTGLLRGRHSRKYCVAFSGRPRTVSPGVQWLGHASRVRIVVLRNHAVCYCSVLCCHVLYMVA